MNSKNISNFNQPNIFDNIYESLLWLTDFRDDELLNHKFRNGFSHTNINNHKCSFESNNTLNGETKDKINVLITGSLYLVGLTLEVLDFHI